ncbi:hypothetical protein, partial [Blautia sp.]|uniref:hypothetical protein n=1 Tax=Blautia sp. TaxID=1955243 RepID=UPI003AB5ACF5
FSKDGCCAMRSKIPASRHQKAIYSASRSALLVTKWTKAISFIKGGSDTRSGSMGKTGKDF